MRSNPRLTLDKRGPADERETDPDPAEEPGAARRGEPGRRAVLAAAVRRPRSAATAWSPAAAVGRRPADPRPLGHGGRQAAAAGPAQGLLGRPAAEPAEPGRRPLHARPSRGLRLQGGGAPGPRGAGLQDGQGRARRRWGASRGPQFITKGDVVVIKPNVAFDKNPDLAATTQPDTRRRRRQALPRRRRPQGDRRRQPDQQPRELLLQDQGRRGRRPRRGRADAAPRTATSSSSTSAARRSPTPGGCSTGRSARRPRSSASRR